MNFERRCLAVSLAALLTGGSLLIGCDKAAPPPAAAPPSSPMAAPPPVTWGPCPAPTDPDADHIPGLQCGSLSVPIDYAKPDGNQATLALIRLPAKGEKIGSLVVNPGGPGESGVDLVPSLVKDAPARVLERFDLVGFDPRGIGRSTPAVDCNTDADDDQARTEPNVDYSPAGVAKIEQDTQEYAQRCLAKTGKEFLDHVGTDSVARDLDQLRAALGDDKLTYLGYSYGTWLGAQYAELFPDRVRAMVLDGAVDPALSPIDEDTSQTAAFEKTFEAYAADCAKSRDCPLGTDPAKAVGVFHSLVDPLVESPARTKDSRGLGYSDAVAGVTDALYSESDWERLTKGLVALREKGPADVLLTLADEYRERDDHGHYTNANDAFNAVYCVDHPYPTDAAAWVEFDRERRELSPFTSYGPFTGHAPRGVCAFWPLPADNAPHAVSVPGLPRTLVISTTGDPATPYLEGVHLAEQMKAALLTYEGDQHTASFYGIPCVDDIVAAYLVELTLPPQDAKCAH